jgi:hypothetical protein
MFGNMFLSSFLSRKPSGPIVEGVLILTKEDGKEVRKRKTFLGQAPCRVDIRDWVYSCMVDANQHGPNTKCVFELIQKND